MANDLVLSHEEFHFEAPYTRNIEIPLLLENRSAQPIAFKMKTLDPKRYTVKPTNGIIASGSSIIVKVTFQRLSSEARVPLFLKSKQKFMVQYRLLDSNADFNQTPAALISKSEGGGPVGEKRIACRFDVDTSFKSTNDQGRSPHAGEHDGQKDENCSTPGPCDQQAAQGGCTVPQHCLVYILVAFFVLLIAIGLAYYFGNKIPTISGKQ